MLSVIITLATGSGAAHRLPVSDTMGRIVAAVRFGSSFKNDRVTAEYRNPGIGFFNFVFAFFSCDRFSAVALGFHFGRDHNTIYFF